MMKRIGRYNHTDDGRAVPALSVVREMAHRLRYPAAAWESRTLIQADAYLVAFALETLDSLVTARGAYGARVGEAYRRAIYEAMMWEPTKEEQ
jgi:hypothetical protein